MRTGAAIARHPDWREALAELTGQIPLLSGEHDVLHPSSRLAPCASSRTLSTTASIRRAWPALPVSSRGL